MAGSTIVLRNTNSLDELQKKLIFTSDSIMKLVAHASEFFDSQIRAMQEQVKFLEKQVEEARERLSQAEKEFGDCLSSQTYDDEDHCFYPSCDCEKETVDMCSEEYYDLQRRDEDARRILSDCESELTKYREPGGLPPPGGETLMKKYLAKELTDEANEKMDKIRECVSKYLSVSCSIRDAKLQRNAEQQQLYEEGVVQIEEKKAATEQKTEEEKAAAFHDATKSMQKEMSHMNFRRANAVAICPQCKRPINVCICQHIIERSR